MKKNALTVIAILFACLFGRANVMAEEMTAQQVMEKSWQLYRQATAEIETVDATIKEDGGAVQQKSFTRWIKYDSAGEDKVTVKFTAPAMDNGLGLLIWRHLAGKDDQWLKLPSQTKVRRISISDQGKYFAGTDVTYEDSRQLIGERTNQFDYQFEIKKDGLTSIKYVIVARPKAGTESAYGKRIFYIDAKFAVIVVEYCDKNGGLIKTQKNEEIQFFENGSWRAGQIIFENTLLKRSTRIKIVDRKLNADMTAEMFTQRFLEQKE